MNRETAAPSKQIVLSSAHDRLARAKVLAELAFADFVNDRLGLESGAVLRIEEALRTYEKLDAEAAVRREHGRPARLESTTKTEGQKAASLAKAVRKHSRRART